MRKSGAATSILATEIKAPGVSPGASARKPICRLLVGFRLPHDFLRGEVDAAGREGVADEEIVGLTREEVLALLEAGILDDGQRQLDRLRIRLPFEGVHGGAHGDRDLSGPGPYRRANQAFL